MKSPQDKAPAGEYQEKTASRKKNTRCYVSEAYGMPAVDLPAGTCPNVVGMGVQAADTYLENGYPGERLADTVARMRGLAPIRHWPDLEAGLMTRIEQCLQSNLEAPRLDNAEKQAALALGNQTMKALHDVAIRVAALAAVGGIVPTSALGHEQLRQLEALASAITWICPVEPGKLP